MIYFLCRADYDTLIHVAGRQSDDPDLAALAFLTRILGSDNNRAPKTLQECFPMPSTRVLDNTIAALAYLLSIGKSTGLSTPMYHTKKAVDFLKRVEISRERNPLKGMFARYITGAVYTVLPVVIETREKGVVMLEDLKADINSRRIKISRRPKWLLQTLDYEIIPALQIRTNRFLTQAYLGQNRRDEAIACLESIIEIAEPESDHANWAQTKRLQITARKA
jgi:hypothetical protein